MKKINLQGGYIALISAILISVSLLTLVIAVSFEGFYSRFSVLESEQKEMSSYLAESCVNTAIIKISQDPNYTGIESVPVGKFECGIVSVGNGKLFSTNRLIQAQGINGAAFTNLEVEIDPDDLPSIEFVSWTEVGSF